MSKKKNAYIGIGLVATVVCTVLVLLPSDDICADEIRGFERSAAASLTAARTGYKQIMATASRIESFTVPPFPNLTPADFSALDACNVQCKLLSRCLKFRIFARPSEACPVEYEDYRQATRDATEFLAELQTLQASTRVTASKALTVTETIEDVERAEKLPGSTGGRLALLKTKSNKARNEFVEAFNNLQLQIDALNSPSMGTRS